MGMHGIRSRRLVYKEVVEVQSNYKKSGDAEAKSRSVSGASRQPAFMSSCLTISHTCLPCLSI